MLPIFFVILLTVADQLSKLAVVQYLKPMGRVEIIKGFFSLTYVENRGAAFGALQGAKWFFVLLTLAVLVFETIYYIKIRKQKNSFLTKCALVLVAAGALGNCIDRLLRGFVVDMLDFRIFTYDWPVFNVADICVVVGVFLAAFCVLKDEKDKK